MYSLPYATRMESTLTTLRKHKFTEFLSLRLSNSLVAEGVDAANAIVIIAQMRSKLSWAFSSCLAMRTISPIPSHRPIDCSMLDAAMVMCLIHCQSAKTASVNEASRRCRQNWKYLAGWLVQTPNHKFVVRIIWLLWSLLVTCEWIMCTPKILLCVNGCWALRQKFDCHHDLSPLCVHERTRRQNICRIRNISTRILWVSQRPDAKWI